VRVTLLPLLLGLYACLTGLVNARERERERAARSNLRRWLSERLRVCGVFATAFSACSVKQRVLG